MNEHKPVINLAFFTILSRIVGFLRVLAVGALLGTTLIGNTFQSTNSISNILFDLLVAGALSSALVPQLSIALNKSDAEFKNIVSSLLTVVLIILGLITIVGFIFAPYISDILFQNVPLGHRTEQIKTGTILIRFFIPQVFLYGIGAVSVAALSAKKIFTPAAIAPIASSIVLVVGLGIFRLESRDISDDLSTKSIIILGITGTLACIGFVIIPVYVGIKNRISMSLSSNFKLGISVLKTSTWAIAIQASAALILGISIFLGNKTPGAVVAYQIGFMFFIAPYAIISQSFSTVVLPDLSLQAANSHEEENKLLFEKNVSKTMSWTYIPLSVLTAIVISLSKPIATIISIGEAKNGTRLFELILISMYIGLMPYGVYQSCSRIFFAKASVKMPALVIFISSVLISIIGLSISSRFEAKNIIIVMGLVHTIAYLISALALVVMLNVRGINTLPNKTDSLFIFGSIIFGSLGFIVSKIVNPNTMTSSYTFISIFIAILFIMMLFIVPNSKLKEYKNAISSRKNINV
ncbi:MAG: lipid II flippase MurJ [Acidimicrobiia bacterium]